jgi:hypothetical protein
LLKTKEVTICNPPHYDEISVSNLYKHCILMPNMMDHFPDNYPKGRNCGREYFFTILSSLHPNYTNELILKCKKDRYTLNDDEQKNEAILIDP